MKQFLTILLFLNFSHSFENSHINQNEDLKNVTNEELINIAFQIISNNKDFSFINKIIPFTKDESKLTSENMVHNPYFKSQLLIYHGDQLSDMGDYESAYNKYLEATNTSNSIFYNAYAMYKMGLISSLNDDYINAYLLHKNVKDILNGINNSSITNNRFFRIIRSKNNIEYFKFLKIHENLKSKNNLEFFKRLEIE